VEIGFSTPKRKASGSNPLRNMIRKPGVLYEIKDPGFFVFFKLVTNKFIYL